jgi:hypothetical protein
VDKARHTGPQTGYGAAARRAASTPAPTQHLAGRATGRRLSDWLPSASNLRKTESALHEYLGLLAWRWDHPG